MASNYEKTHVRVQVLRVRANGEPLYYETYIVEFDNENPNAPWVAGAVDYHTESRLGTLRANSLERVLGLIAEDITKCYF